MKKIFVIHAVSCRRRSLDAKKISDYLSKNGYEIVFKPEDADIIIFVTCGFIDTTTDYCLEKIEQLQKYDAELIVAGCLPDMEPDRLSKIFNGRVIRTKEIDKINEFFPETKVKFNDLDDKNILFKNLNKNSPIEVIKNIFENVQWIKKPVIKLEEHTFKNLFGSRSFVYKLLFQKPFLIRISWGCLGNCSYCKINKAIGTLKSKPVDECLKEIKRGLNSGYKNFFLTADDAGAYGLDINTSFPELLEKMVNLNDNFTVGIESLKPMWIVKYLEELKKIFSSGKIEYVDCSIQSGSNRILKLMNRYSEMEKILDSILELKKKNQNLLLTTEIIIGFPSETEKDIQQTLSFIKKVNFNTVFLYQFELKSGTAAEKIEPKIPEKEMSRRMQLAKKFFKNNGYKQIHIPKMNFSSLHKFLIFDKSN